MTMPHLMNCAHSDDGWCLDCVKKLWDHAQFVANESIAKGGEEFLLRRALSHAREAARANGVTTRKFAEWCQVSPTQLSKWTGTIPDREPDLIERREDLGL